MHSRYPAEVTCCCSSATEHQQASARRGSRLVRQLGAIVTFGQPRTGDAEYARNFEARFGDRAFRYVCGCDLVRRAAVCVAVRCLYYMLLICIELTTHLLRQHAGLLSAQMDSQDLQRESVPFKGSAAVSSIARVEPMRPHG